MLSDFELHQLSTNRKIPSGKQTNVNSKSSCCTVNNHMVNNLLIMLSKDDVENKNVSIDQCMSGINISNCISKFDQNKIASPSKPKGKTRRIRKL
jgi:hypothetical protein